MRLRQFLGAAAGLALAACGGAAPSAAPTTSAAPQSVKIVTYPGALASWLGYIADQKGYFKRNNLDVQFVTLTAGAQATNAMASGSIDVAMLDALNVAPLMANGVPMKLLVNEQTNNWQLVGSKSASGQTFDQVIKGLRGQQVAAPSVGGAGGRLTQLLALGYGLQATDIKVVADVFGTGFAAGHEAAYMQDPINTSNMAGQGFPIVFSFLKPVAPKSSYPADVQRLIGLADLGYWSQADWANAHSGAVRGLQRAIAQTSAWAASPGNAAELARIMRASPYNVAAMSDTQWRAAVELAASSFQAHFTKQDRDTWNDVVSKLGIASGMPQTSAFFASGLPQSAQQAAALAKA